MRPRLIPWSTAACGFALKFQTEGNRHLAGNSARKSQEFDTERL
jgi:hypothetical protein